MSAKFKSLFNIFDGVIIPIESYQLCCWTDISILNRCQLDVTSTLAKRLSAALGFCLIAVNLACTEFPTLSPKHTTGTIPPELHIGLQFSIVMDGKIAPAPRGPRPGLFIDCSL